LGRSWSPILAVSRSCKDLIRVGGDHKLKVAKRCGKKVEESA